MLLATAWTATELPDNGVGPTKEAREHGAMQSQQTERDGAKNGDDADKAFDGDQYRRQRRPTGSKRRWLCVFGWWPHMVGVDVRWKMRMGKKLMF
ncbi:hypothetical protein DEO72_LG7g2102 [Vigna unguiculata]|uniref:Uncharacterized protein n=1 Tax=Vigna unguiculata TaxID=3917 RepID=A0A4D6MJC9_VIGUN|nr:hypothetical protein DEO72_LG7g2102 [Vigna unguiculata]